MTTNLTLETNPRSLNIEYLSALKQSGAFDIVRLNGFVEGAICHQANYIVKSICKYGLILINKYGSEIQLPIEKLNKENDYYVEIETLEKHPGNEFMFWRKL